jgi:curved DNA-binding protein CbpA
VTTRDLYEVLGVARDATDSQIKRAYHKLAMVHHPDKRAQNPSGEEPNTLNPKPQTPNPRQERLAHRKPLTRALVHPLRP